MIINIPGQALIKKRKNSFELDHIYFRKTDLIRIETI